jgi:hypothetical protein
VTVTSVRALLVRPGEQPQIVDVDPDPAGEALRGLVDGPLEIVAGDDWHLYCNENSRRLELPHNRLASAILTRLQPWRTDRLHGPVVFLGRTGSAEADVPAHVEQVASKLTAGELLGAWTDTGATRLQAAEPGPDTKLIRLAAAVTRRIVTGHGWRDDRNAIACTRVAAGLLERFGHTAVPVSVAVMVLSKLCADTDGRQGHCVGTLGTGRIDPHGPNGGVWDGHLLLLVDGTWLLDIAAPMFDRPAHDIDVPEPMCWRLPDTAFGRVLEDGDRLFTVRRDGSVVRYAVNGHTMWQQTPDWTGRHDRFAAAVDEAARLLQPYIRSPYAGDDRPWRCTTCRAGIKRINLPDGTVQYAHARPWEVTDGHDVVAEQVDDITQVRTVCDFCGDPDPVYAYAGPDLVQASKVNPLTGRPRQPGDGFDKPGTEFLGEQWLGCGACDRFVTAGDLEGLMWSTLRSQRNRATRVTPQLLEAYRRENMPRWAQYVPNIRRRRMLNPPAVEPINPRNLPRHRARLARFLGDEQFPAFGNDHLVVVLPGPDADRPDELVVQVQGAAVARHSAAYSARIVAGLEQAELYYVSQDFTDLAMSSGADLADMSITVEELPAPHGLVMWATPVMTSDARHTRAVDEAQVVAASWTTIPGLGVWINWYVRTDQLYPGELQMREAIGLLLPWANGIGLPFGENPAGVDTTAVFPGHTDGLSGFRTLLATWFLILQPGVAETEIQVSRDKQLVKRAARAGLPPPEVRVVDLRHSRRPAPAAAGIGRQVTVRFPVRGHWRRQAYGKGRALRRNMYIAPFMKGPEGAPLVSGRAVAVVRVLK